MPICMISTALISSQSQQAGVAGAAGDTEGLLAVLVLLATQILLENPADIKIFLYFSSIP